MRKSRRNSARLGFHLNRKHAAAAAAGGIVLCALVALWLRPPSLEQVGRRGLEAVRTRNAGLLLANLT